MLTSKVYGPHIWQFSFHPLLSVSTVAPTQCKHQSIFLPGFCSKLPLCTKSWHCYPSLGVQRLTRRKFHSLHLDHTCCCLKGWTVFNCIDLVVNTSKAYYLPSLPPTGINRAAGTGNAWISMGHKCSLSFTRKRRVWFLFTYQRAIHILIVLI